MLEVLDSPAKPAGMPPQSQAPVHHLHPNEWEHRKFQEHPWWNLLQGHLLPPATGNMHYDFQNPRWSLYTNEGHAIKTATTILNLEGFRICLDWQFLPVVKNTHLAVCHVPNSFLSMEQLSLLDFQEAVSGRVLSPTLPLHYFNDRHRQKEGIVTKEAPLSKQRIATINSLCRPHWSPGDKDSH